MGWANPNEYVEALQHPQQAFADADLKTGTVVTNKLGLPRPISGNFATVFEVTNGSRKWAVRCFLREVTDQQQRYAAIAAHLQRHPLPFMVDFAYLPQGIRVRGRWFPILKMDWTAGERLDTYIEAHLDDARRLHALADQWIAVCRELRESGIAHGDLQHGNVLVSDRDAIKLIDYDGMIVSGAVNLPMGEIGHRHYQHPTRSQMNGIGAATFRDIDNFSAQTISASLLALSIDASLWRKTGAGDENLLFRDVDYEKPEQSKVFDLLARHDDGRVRALGEMMLRAVDAPTYLDVPPLERSPISSRSVGIRDWLSHRLAVEPPPQVHAPPETPPDSWIADHVQAEQAATDAAPLERLDDFAAHERWLLANEFRASPLKDASLLFPAYCLLRVAVRYGHYPLVVERSKHAEHVQALGAALDDAKTRRKALARRVVEADRRYQQELNALAHAVAQVEDEIARDARMEEREIGRIQRIVNSIARELTWQPLEPERVAGIGAAQVAALARVGIRTAADITPEKRDAALRALASVETNEDARSQWEALAAWRAYWVEMTSPAATPPSVADIPAIRRQHAAQRRELERQRDEYQRQWGAVKSFSQDWRIVKQLRGELDEVEHEVAALQRQHEIAVDQLAQYGGITFARVAARVVTGWRV